MEFNRQKYLDEIILKKHNHQIKVITGIRRAGKTYLLKELFYRHLIGCGVSSRNIISFAFDSEEDIDKLNEFYPEEKTKIYIKEDEYVVNSKKFRAYIKTQINEEEEFYFLLDEIQILEDFKGTLNGFLTHKNYDIYVSGSNSRFLSSDIETEFAGRGDEIHVLPLTFSEFYNECGKLKEEAWSEYQQTGGIPLVVLDPTLRLKENRLLKLEKEVYLKDLVTHNRIKNDSDISDLLFVLASSIGSGVNMIKLSNTYESIKHKKLGDDTIKKYIDFMTDAFLLNQVTQYDISGKKYINYPFKVYFEDVGIRNSILDFKRNEPGHILENIVYNELRYRGYNVFVGSIDINEKTENLDKNGKKIYAKKKTEVDFIASFADEQYYIQVCLNLYDDTVMERELRPLKAIKDSYKKIIITKDGLGSRRTGDGIVIMDVFDFLLNPNSLSY